MDMQAGRISSWTWRIALFVVIAAAWSADALTEPGAQSEALRVIAAGFNVGAAANEVHEGGKKVTLTIDASAQPLPFNQSALKQGSKVARLGPDPAQPYFTVRFALPIPPENGTDAGGARAGVDPMVFTHNHSPGFEILPNGDALAIYFSTPPGKAEADASTSFVQARLRFGAEDWDLPELFYKTENQNDQSGLLWQDGKTLRFFGGGRGFPDSIPFKQATSTDNGASWTLSLPQLDKPAQHYTAQPITSAFRSPDDSIYFAMDGVEASSFLWRSMDDGVHWHDMGGRTGGRHSVIVPLDDKGRLLSIGGKNNAVNGWSPQNFSSDWGATWSSNTASPFPPLGTAQRPSMIRLASGNLLYVGESYIHKGDKPAPAGWKFGDNCFVAISTNNGTSWHIKTLPVQLPGHQRTNHPTLGYVTARQGPNGVIHILTTVTQPCLNYEMNEAWIFSGVGDMMPESTGGKVESYREDFPDGSPRVTWSARICSNGRYLLDGKETSFFPSGKKEHEVAYASGRKTGEETFWAENGTKLWSWKHDPKKNVSIWTQYWPNGKKKLESTWSTRSEARDLKRPFIGLVANGLVKFWTQGGSLEWQGSFVNGEFAGKELL